MSDVKPAAALAVCPNVPGFELPGPEIPGAEIDEQGYFRFSDAEGEVYEKMPVRFPMLPVLGEEQPLRGSGRSACRSGW